VPIGAERFSRVKMKSDSNRDCKIRLRSIISNIRLHVMPDSIPDSNLSSPWHCEMSVHKQNKKRYKQTGSKLNFRAIGVNSDGFSVVLGSTNSVFYASYKEAIKFLHNYKAIKRYFIRFGYRGGRVVHVCVN